MTCQDFNPKDDTQAQGVDGFTLEVGKTYITRDGKQFFTVTEIDPGAPRRSAITAKRHGGACCWFSPNGTFNVRPEGGDSWDLVREIQEGEALPEPKAKGSESPSQISEERQKADLPPLSPPATADAKEAEPSPALEAMRSIRTSLNDLGFLPLAVDEIMGVFIEQGWRPKAGA